MVPGPTTAAPGNELAIQARCPSKWQWIKCCTLRHEVPGLILSISSATVMLWFVSSLPLSLINTKEGREEGGREGRRAGWSQVPTTPRAGPSNLF